MKYVLSIVLIILAFQLYGQDTTKILSRYRIVESFHGKENYSDFEQKRKGVIFIHYNKDSKLYLSNISLDSGSFSTGLLTLLENDTIYINTTKRLKVKSVYNWLFTNSYDKEKGNAKINLIEEDSNYGKIFTMTIFLKDNEEIVYKGFIIDKINDFIIPKTIF